MQASCNTNRKVTPNVIVASEGKFFHVSSGRFEACLWVFRSDPYCNHVALGLGLGLSLGALVVN